MRPSIHIVHNGYVRQGPACGKGQGQGVALAYYVFSASRLYAISVEQLSEKEDATAEQRCVYLIGMAKSAQQKLRYNLHGSTNNQFNEKVFTGPGLHPDQLVKVHLGLVGEHANKTFLEM